MCDACVGHNTSRCRRCGREFEERSLSPYRICNSDEGYLEHRYCPSCRWAQKRAARACDVCAALPYAWHGNWRMAVYWLAAATLTACVTYTGGK